MATLGVVIRADGTVPFDEGSSPRTRMAILDHVEAMGHGLQHSEECTHDGDNAKCNCDPKIVGWGAEHAPKWP
jgi:hypothetical protein